MSNPQPILSNLVVVFATAFRDVGFREVGRASETQLIMRYTVGQGQ